MLEMKKRAEEIRPVFNHQSNGVTSVAVSVDKALFVGFFTLFGLFDDLLSNVGRTL